MKNKKQLIISISILVVAIAVIVCMFLIPMYSLTLNANAESPLSTPAIDGQKYTFVQLFSNVNMKSILGSWSWDYGTEPLWIYVLAYLLHFITFIGVYVIAILAILSIVQCTTKIVFFNKDKALKLFTMSISIYGLICVLLNVLALPRLNDGCKGYVYMYAESGIYVLGALLVIALVLSIFSGKNDSLVAKSKTRSIISYAVILALSVLTFVFIFMSFDKSGNAILSGQFIQTIKDSYKRNLNRFIKYGSLFTIPMFIAIPCNMVLSTLAIIFTCKNKNTLVLDKLIKIFTIISMFAIIIYFIGAECYIALLYSTNMVNKVLQMSGTLVMMLIIMWLLPMCAYQTNATKSSKLTKKHSK